MKQVRHKKFGIFQGDFCGLCFWTNLTEDMEEQGLYSFESTEDAQKFIDECIRFNQDDEEFTSDKFIVEGYNQELNDSMERIGKANE